ncbi:MAG: hypothetical protein WBM69_22265 [Desulfobacterales bacterium]
MDDLIYKEAVFYVMSGTGNTYRVMVLKGYSVKAIFSLDMPSNFIFYPLSFYLTGYSGI